MNYSAKFYPEKRNGSLQNVPIVLSVSYSGKRIFYYTGKRCNIDPDPEKSQWNYEKNEMKRNQVAPDGKTATRFNSDLNKIRVAVNDLFDAYNVNQVNPTIKQLRDDLKRKLGKEVKVAAKNDFFSLFDQYIKAGEQSDNRKKCIRTVYNGLKKFAPDTTFENLDVKAFKKYLVNKPTSNNSIVEYLTKLKAFINWAIKENFTTVQSFLSIEIGSGNYGRPIYITIKERDLLFDAVIDNKSLAVVRDIFVLQCHLGCRYGDLMRFRKSNIIDNGIQYINEKRKKESVMVIRVPLTEKAKTIISRYNLPDGRLVPYLELNWFDIQLKILFDKVEITRNVSIPDFKTGLEVQVSISTLASSHMARRCFIGGLHKKVKNEIIASMSGHVKDSKAFGRYYDVDQEDQQAAMKLIE